MENLWITILSSAGVASVISALAGYIFNVLMQKRKYKDDYYKMVIGKRMDAYVKVEEIYKLLKTNISEDSGKTSFCIIFNDKDFFKIFYKKLYNAIGCSVWLSEDINDDLRHLNDMLLLVDKSLKTANTNIRELGKEKCAIFTEIYLLIGEHYKNDMLNLHNVEGFLKSKNTKK